MRGLSVCLVFCLFLASVSVCALDLRTDVTIEPSAMNASVRMGVNFSLSRLEVHSNRIRFDNTWFSFLSDRPANFTLFGLGAHAISWNQSAANTTFNVNWSSTAIKVRWLYGNLVGNQSFYAFNPKSLQYIAEVNASSGSWVYLNVSLPAGQSIPVSVTVRGGSLSRVSSLSAFAASAGDCWYGVLGNMVYVKFRAACPDMVILYFKSAVAPEEPEEERGWFPPYILPEVRDLTWFWVLVLVVFGGLTIGAVLVVWRYSRG